MKLRVAPSAVSGTVLAPPSKSYTHRAIIVGSLAEGETVIDNFLDADDTRYTINACRVLGVEIQIIGDGLKIAGSGGRFPTRPEPQMVFVGNSGSTIRMAAALAALAPGRIVFDGEARLRQRPVGDLLSTLSRLGVKVRSVNKEGYPPIEVWGGQLSGGEVAVSGSISSQHISALLMVAPYAKSPITVKIIDQLHSRPYIDITVDVMGRFGVEVDNRGYREFEVRSGQKYQGRRYKIKGDYSSAAYFFAASAIEGGRVTVGNLEAGSVQGDRYFLDILSAMGCRVNYHDGQVIVTRHGELTGISVDMGDYPDIVQPLAVVAAFARGETRMSNIGHLTYKETDRIRNTAGELGKMGIKVDVTGDAMTIAGGRPRGASIETYNDHRMAMSFAIAGLFADGETIINGAEATSKSYPGFFADLSRIGANISEAG